MTKTLNDKGIEFGHPDIRYLIAKVSNYDVTKKISNFHQLGQAGLGIIQSLVKITPEDIAQIKKELKDKRIIVILDDLDRMEAALIPRLLMSLRELMDLEGFSFLLPFDDKFVSNALAKYNEADGFGENFLEEILDYRVYLPVATKDQIMAFFSHELKKHCPFIGVEILEGLDEFLPTNPRKLKTLVRELRVFEVEGNRHRQEEIDWKALIFGRMIKAESESFFKVYEKDTFYPEGRNSPHDKSRGTPWIIAFMERDKEKAEQVEKARITGLLEKVSVTLPEKRERLLKLCNGWRESYGLSGQHKIEYALKLLEEPETLTWAELDDLWSLWIEKQNFNDLFSWISEHAYQMERPEDEVARELLIAVSQKYDLHLEKASSVALQSEQEVCINEAIEVLKLIDLFIDESVPGIPQEKILTVDVFKKLFGVIAKWFHFRGNRADRELRVREEQLLTKWVQKSHALGMSRPYYTLLKKSDRANSYRREIEGLCRVLSILVSGDIEDIAREVLKKENGIQEIFPNGVGEDIKSVLLAVNSNLWKPVGNSPVEQILSTAHRNPTIQKNALGFLDLLRSASDLGIWDMTSEKVREFYRHPRLVAAIWNAAIATPLQFNQLKETRQIRDYLISMGVAEDQLPLPGWLIEAVENIQDEKQEPVAAE